MISAALSSSYTCVRQKLSSHHGGPAGLQARPRGRNRSDTPCKGACRIQGSFLQCARPLHQHQHTCEHPYRAEQLQSCMPVFIKNLMENHYGCTQVQATPAVGALYNDLIKNAKVRAGICLFQNAARIPKYIA